MTRLIDKVLLQTYDDVGVCFDWFEVRVQDIPNIKKLAELGYCEDLDKGCATHNHYFETDSYSVAWDIKSSYVKTCWTHIRLKNELLYRITDPVDYIRKVCKDLFYYVSDDGIIITRIDVAYDMPVGSFYYNILRSKFELHELDVEKYTEFHGKVGKLEFTNYSAGSRSAQRFFRLYYKSVENTDYQKHVAKKQYIKDYHDKLFGVNVQVARFEIELKPQGNHILDDTIYSEVIQLFRKYADGYLAKLQIYGRYDSGKTEFSERDLYLLVRLMKKYLHSNHISKMQISAYLQTYEQFVDILENVFNQNMNDYV